MPLWIITGANRGLGLEFITQLATDSSNTIIAAVRSLSNDLTSLKAVQSQNSSIHILECDTGSQESISKFGGNFSKSFGAETQIDFLLNNAGINATPDQTSLTMTPDSLANHMNVNVMGPARMVQVLESHLQRGSVVMNMTSGLGSLAYNVSKEVLEATVYSMSKAALNMLTVHQAGQWEGKGVKFLAVDPGWVKTDMGGSKAVLEKEESISGMLKILKSKDTKSGDYLEYNGSKREW
ncbi:C-signal protein [Leptodontidium sp. 2 PMI_412]|nr:short chain dehydrogenase/reductase SDR [Leptodontidium sp. MPI-SDFR-AT-0119]KAH9223304.1 C-signal protein [Leptodontidium sp. 2 PMI_412]